MALNKYGYNAIARHVTAGLLTGALLFAGAGTTDWPEGWVLAIVYTAGWIVLSAVLARTNPELLNERGKRSGSGAGTKSWDWVLLAIYAVVQLVQPFVAGLDRRYGWSGQAATLIYIAGHAAIVSGFALLTWAMAVNRFFEGTVRLQSDRGQTVMTGGPYQYVRHPGYTAVILLLVGVALAAGSWAALGVGLIGIVTFIVRTKWEDDALHAELPGYREFAQQTRYRLLPGVW
jgi:protein-S-isoprenylcysteine O-methyltransferase Ste14